MSAIPASYEIARDVAANGSPLLLQAVGRAFGLGAAERQALAGPGKGGGVPGWFWLTAGLAIGVVAGVRVYRAWPDRVPELVKGRP